MSRSRKIDRYGKYKQNINNYDPKEDTKNSPITIDDITGMGLNVDIAERHNMKNCKSCCLTNTVVQHAFGADGCMINCNGYIIRNDNHIDVNEVKDMLKIIYKVRVLHA